MAVTELINAVTEEAPLALLIDDLHWADDASYDALQVLVNRLERQPLLLVTASRPDYRPDLRGLATQQITIDPLPPEATFDLVTSLARLPGTAWAAPIAGQRSPGLRGFTPRRDRIAGLRHQHRRPGHPRGRMGCAPAGRAGGTAAPRRVRRRHHPGAGTLPAGAARRARRCRHSPAWNQPERDWGSVGCSHSPVARGARTRRPRALGPRRLGGRARSDQGPVARDPGGGASSSPPAGSAWRCWTTRTGASRRFGRRRFTCASAETLREFAGPRSGISACGGQPATRVRRVPSSRTSSGPAWRTCSFGRCCGSSPSPSGFPTSPDERRWWHPAWSRSCSRAHSSCSVPTLTSWPPLSEPGRSLHRPPWSSVGSPAGPSAAPETRCASKSRLAPERSSGTSPWQWWTAGPVSMISTSRCPATMSCGSPARGSLRSSAIPSGQG
jgi:hypothetical protein